MSADVYFQNLGINTVPTYRVSFENTLFEVFESNVAYTTPGWVFPTGHYVGVWDGLLQVTPTAIAGATQPPAEILVSVVGHSASAFTVRSSTLRGGDGLRSDGQAILVYSGLVPFAFFIVEVDIFSAGAVLGEVAT